MAGGPINGGGNNSIPLPVVDTIIVPTVLQISADAINWFTSLTCIYDRYWEPTQGVVTLPVAMFHVKKITTTHSTDVSKKRVVLYEQQDSSAKDKADSMRPSVMRTVIDNAVKQPTTYSVEAIVPFQPLGRYFTESYKMVSDIVTTFSDIFGGASNAVTNGWEGMLSSIFALAKNVGTVLNALAKLPIGGGGVAQLNMNSLEAMADSCRTLCMKMWTGYDYKFVMMTGLSFEKNPNEDDVFRATFQLQEIPVLAVSPPNPLKKGLPGSKLLSQVVAGGQGLLTAPFVRFTGVKTAATGGEDKAVLDNLLDAAKQ